MRDELRLDSETAGFQYYAALLFLYFHGRS
jgi:hypothetical protein